ncbi:discoidin domain-containing protein [Xanthomonas theicola]|uniref:F5/8 type C domain-containing protein n=1 Tax=Xanthomonas theicola TaxID=56464 RepID=A0A2S6ZHF6_9XANT|nr:discoidin domain-containing protein [Xanthomonas theicola]PPT91702.1 hypothetical protein XthCFBP4691_06615 [Xanthomonas theicola]QNH27120.1 hypothetical protein G4Q83_16570 [Xanthomonas theicola]
MIQPVWAQDGTLPPRDAWRASSSSSQVKAQAIAYLIDGDATTRTGGAFSPGHWFQVDLGREARVGGVRLQWDTANPEGFLLQASHDAQRWETVYTMVDSMGGTETLFFTPRRARYLRLASPERSADWGVSIYEMEPLGEATSARLRGIPVAEAAALWQGGTAVTMPGKGTQARQLDIAFPRAFSSTGLIVEFAGAHGATRLQAQDAAGRWTTLAEDPQAAQSDSAYLAGTTPVQARVLRLSVDAAPGGTVPALRRLRLLGPKAVMTPMKRYQMAAQRGQRALFPASLHMQQIYWTAVGIHAGRQKSIFDEYGNLEAWKGAPLVQPLWRDASGTAAGADSHALTHALRDGWKPIPSVRWSPQPGLELRSETFAIEHNGQPATLLRHRLRNTGNTPIDGTLSLLVRPMQINPPWQNGGLSPIHALAIDASAVRVNGRLLLESLSPPSGAGAEAFGAHGETEITRHVAAGTLPAQRQARDADGLAAGMLNYAVALAPGAQQDVVLAFPLGTASADAQGRLPPAPALDRAALLAAAPRDPGRSFDALADRVSADWQRRLGNVGLTLPDASLVDMLRAQAAYMLINQTGPAMQPGPRNYNRSFIRDGMATSAILLRMGQAKVARDYLRWYSDHAVHPNGLVSPILNDDGSVNDGFGSDLEYDSQGQYITLVADVARLDGGPDSVRAFMPKVKLAMQFMQELRERTLVPGYMAEQPAPERFRGILAPSISHEGYSSPTHSYWDDYWALKGWHDGAWLAESLGDTAIAAWAREQYAALRTSLAASILATMAWKGADFIPAAADLGDGDPSSVSIALDPTRQQDLLPEQALRTTFARYLDDVRKRKQPNALWAYSPYEMRNVLTYVHLDQPQVADELLQDMMRDRRPFEWQVLAEVVQSRLRFPRYLGDMPHTWIGAEYARALFGMLMHEGDDALVLLPGAPPAWLEGEGLSLQRLPTAYGQLSMRARARDGVLRIELGSGLRAGTAVRVAWPSRTRPTQLRVDGRRIESYDAGGVVLGRPFRTLEARW